MGEELWAQTLAEHFPAAVELKERELGCRQWEGVPMSPSGPRCPPAMQESTPVVRVLDFVRHGLTMRMDVVPVEIFH